MEIDKIEICTSSQTFENGVISWRLCSKNQCAMLTGENAVQNQCIVAAIILEMLRQNF